MSSHSCDDEWLKRWMEYFLAWYDEGNVEEKAREAAEFSQQFLDEGIVSVSGGKDSMAMLHIISRVKRDVEVFHWDHGPTLMPREIEREIIRNIGIVAPEAKLIIKKFELGSREEARHSWSAWYRAFFGTLRELNRKYHLLGIRKDESSRRSRRGRVVRRKDWTEIHPIYSFTWRDVWAYIFRHNIPIPKTYYAYARLLGWDKVRLVTFFDREFEKYGAPQIDGVLAWRWKYVQ